MTDAIFGMMARLASPFAQGGARLRALLVRRPWLRLAVAPVILLAAAGLALMALLAGRHDLVALTLFIALPFATACLILCHRPDDDTDHDADDRR